MANIQIPNLGPAIALNGQEQLEIVQAGVSLRTTSQDISNLSLPYIQNLEQYVNALQKIPCASFYSTVTQSHGGIGNEALVSCNNIDFQYSINVVGGDQFKVDVAGIYNFQFSLQLVSPTNNKHVYVWLKKNGIVVPQSNTEVDLPNKDYGYVAAWNFLLDLNAGDYIQLAWTSDDGVQIKANASPPYGPAIPSVIATMNMVRRTSGVLAGANYLTEINMEQLTITTLNTIPQLAQNYSGEVFILVVNGYSFVLTGASPSFSVSGKNVTWLSTVWSINPGDDVVAVYSYEV